MKKIGTKILCVAILLCLVFSLAACGISFDHKFVRSDILLGESEGKYVFNSLDEVEEFLHELEAKILIHPLSEQNLEQYVAELTQLFEEFDEEFFQTNILILVGLVETSGSNRHEVQGVYVSGDRAKIDIKRISPEIGTCDMAYWQLFLSVSKDDFDGNKVEVKIS